MLARFVGIGFLLFLSGCTVLPGLHLDVDAANSDPAFELVPITPQVVFNERVRALNERSAAASPATLVSVNQAADSYGYTVSAGDVLQIVVFDHPELTNPSATAFGWWVDHDGTIFYPYVGRLSVAGLSPAQVATLISDRLRGVLQSPQVDVRVSEYRSQRVQVTGEVRSPGIVYLDDTPKGLLEAINERGGLTEAASRHIVRLTRDGEVYQLDMDALNSRGGSNILLQHGDVVYVADSSREKVFVLGEVGTERALSMDRGFMTLTEALASSGGLSGSADRRAVFVFRGGDFIPEGVDLTGADNALASWVPRVFVLDLSRADSLLLADQFELNARDVVYVSSTSLAAWNQVISQILPTVSTLFQLERLVNTFQ